MERTFCMTFASSSVNFFFCSTHLRTASTCQSQAEAAEALEPSACYAA